MHKIFNAYVYQYISYKNNSSYNSDGQKSNIRTIFNRLSIISDTIFAPKTLKRKH